MQFTREDLADAWALRQALLTAQSLTPEQRAAAKEKAHRRRAEECKALIARWAAVWSLVDDDPASHRRLEAVLILHAPDGYGYCKGCTGDEPPRWDDCPTIAAIKGDQ